VFPVRYGHYLLCVLNKRWDIRSEVYTAVTMKNAAFCVALVRTVVSEELKDPHGVISRKAAFFKI
jgi:hypothetical protein